MMLYLLMTNIFILLIIKNTKIGSLVVCIVNICIFNNYRSSGTVLRALDLSYNQLDKVPLKSFSNIKSLDWLNLHG